MRREEGDMSCIQHDYEPHEQETYDYPVVTQFPHVEAPLEQPRVAEPVCRLLILRDTDFVPRVIFVRGAPMGCAQVG